MAEMISDHQNTPQLPWMLYHSHFLSHCGLPSIVWLIWILYFIIYFVVKVLQINQIENMSSIDWIHIYIDIYITEYSSTTLLYDHWPSSSYSNTRTCIFRVNEKWREEILNNNRWFLICKHRESVLLTFGYYGFLLQQMQIWFLE